MVLMFSHISNKISKRDTTTYGFLRNILTIQILEKNEKKKTSLHSRGSM
jgi:hypothetical protein